MNRVLSLVFVLCLMLCFGMASAQTTYTKVTSASQLVDGGKYLIVYEDGNVAFDGSLTSLDAVGNTKPVTISDGTISVTDNDFYFTLGVIDGGYSVKSASNYYIGNTSDANTLKTSQTEVYVNTLEVTASSIEIISANTHLRFNSASDQNRFRYFKSTSYTNQKAISLFVDASSLSDDPMISITTPSNGSTIYTSSVTATVQVLNFIVGTDGNISFAIDSEDAIVGTETSHTFEGLTDGEHTITASLVATDETVVSTATTTFTVDLDGPTTTPIHDIQYTEAEDGASQYNGQTVTVSGTVTGFNSDKFYIQDAEAAWSGLYIYNTNSSLTPSLSDNVTVTGSVTEYNGLTELTPTEIINNGAATAVNGLTLSSISEIGEPYESVLVTVTGTCTNIGGAKKWTISDGTSIVVFGLTYTPTVGISYTVTGIVDWFGQDGIWELKPRSEADIVAGAGVPSISITSPANGSTVYSSTVNATVEVLNFTVGTDGNISFSIDNGTAVTGTETTHTFADLTDGQHTITASLVATDETVVATATTTFTVDLDGPTTTPIHDIQYTEAEDGASPYNGQTVTVSGTVTALNSDKFYIQDEEAAWSGLYIYNTNSDRTPARNDNVTVTGTITEYNGLTEMSPVTEVVNNGAVTPVNGLSLASISEIAEPYESVLVTVTGTCTNIGGTKKWTISDGTSIVVFGLTYTPTVGTSYTVTGIVDWYGQDNIWELKPRDENDIVAGAAVPAITITNPANGSTIYSSSVNATVEVVNFEIGTDGNVSFSIDNEDAVSGTAISHTFEGLTDGQHTITANLVGTNQSVIATATTTFTVYLDGPTTTPIHDIQYTEAEDGASPYNGQTVTVSGTVTALNSDKFYIQDEEAAWSGLYIYNTNSDRTPARNDNVTVTGTITEYNGLTEMSPVTEVVNNGAVTPVNGLSLASISEIAEPYESVLVTVTGTCTNIGGTKKWTISDGTSIVVFGLTYTPTVGTSYTVTGIVDWYGQDNIWELKPRDESDIVVGAAAPTISITSPANGSTVYSSTVNATVEVLNFTVGTDGNISFSIDNGTAVTGTETTHTFAGLTDGQHTITASLVGTNQSVIATATTTFTVDLDGPTTTPIHDIQYTEAEDGASPYNGQTVTVSGTVTALNSDKFYIQDEEAAWSGLYIYNTNSDRTPARNDNVTVTGTITEYNGLTEMSPVTEVVNNGAVTPVNGLSLASISEIAEPYESVLVTVTGTCTNIGGTKKWTISDGTSIVVFGLTYTPTVGTSYTVTGIVDWYGQDNIWELKPRDENDIVAGAAVPAITITNPANGSTIYSSSVNATVEVVNFEIGTDGNVSFSIDNEDAVSGTETSHTFADLTDGEHTITANLVGTDQSIIATAISTFTVDLNGSSLTSIYDVQHTDATDGASPLNGQTVTVRGTVTALNSDKFYIQDAEAAWSGLYIYNTNSDRTPARNDNVTVTGTITEYNGLTEMNPTAVVNNGSSTPINGLALASISEIGESYESVLVTVTGTCTEIGGTKKWTINDGTSIVVFGLTYTPIVGTSYTVTGIVDWYGQENIWELKPRDENDIVAGAAVPAITITNPAHGSTVYTSTINATVEVFNFTVGTDGNISFSIDNEDAVSGTATSHTYTDLTDGEHTITANLVGTDQSIIATATSTFTVNLSPDFTSIHDIQYTTAEDGASPYNGQTVIINGTVTGFNGDKFYVQDAEAAWSGLYIYNTNSDRTPSRNDNVIVSGTITEYNGLTEMNPTAVVNNGEAAPINGLELASISEIGEPYESVLVTVTGICTNIGGANKWTINDGTSIVVFGLTYTPTVGTTYTVTGIVDWYGQEGIWELKPRDENDIVAGAAVPAITITRPANGSTVYSSVVNATVSVFNFTPGTDGNISISLDDEDAIMGTETSHTYTGVSEGEHTITASLVATGNNIIATATSTFTVDYTVPETTPIREIQYTTEESGDSPLNNQTVWVKGVVTSNFINTPYFPVKGYSIQDANEAWSGIWVFDSNNNPNIGDSVKFQAKVAENYGLTELTNVANFEIYDIGVVSPIDVTVNEAKSEAYEGCYVRVECVRSLGSTMPYGNWSCVNETGDTVTFSHNFENGAYPIEKNKYYRVAGIVEYSYGAYYVNYPSVNDIVADCDASVDEMISNAIEVYPNPTNGQINIMNAEGQNIVVINTLGQVVATVENASENQTIDMSGLCDGTYFVKVGASVVKINVIR